MWETKAAVLEAVSIRADRTRTPASAAPWPRAVSEVHAAMPLALRDVLNRIAVGETVPAYGYGEALKLIASVRGPAKDIALGTLMAAAMSEGPRPQVVTALIDAALSLGASGERRLVTSPTSRVVVVAGSGKKGARTRNVSTPSALVAAAAGAKVIKVGSTATSSSLGSRDLIHALGIKERFHADDVAADLDTTGFAFLAVEPHIPAVDEFYGGRFYAPNPFSFGLAALASPVRGDITMYGLAHPRVDVAAAVLLAAGMGEVDVYTTRMPGSRMPGSAYLDEIGLTGTTLSSDGTLLVEEHLDAAVGMRLPEPCDAREAVRATLAVLSGHGDPSHHVLVVRNAARILANAGIHDSIASAMATADEIVSTGAALPLARHVGRAAR